MGLLSRFFILLAVFSFLFFTWSQLLTFKHLFSFPKQVIHGKDFNFSSRHLQYEILKFSSSKKLQRQGRWFVYDSMQLRAWFKQKKKIDTVFGVDVAELEKTNALIRCWKWIGLCQRSVLNLLWYLLVSQKAKPNSTYIFRFSLQINKKGNQISQKRYSNFLHLKT